MDGAGVPIFCLSPLAIHARNIIEDPRCSMVVQMPGWTDLANAHITIFGDVYQLPPEMQSAARDVRRSREIADCKLSAHQVASCSQACRVPAGCYLHQAAPEHAETVLSSTKRRCSWPSSPATSRTAG